MSPRFTATLCLLLSFASGSQAVHTIQVGPGDSLQRAIEKARQHRQANDEAIEIRLRGGQYQISRSIVLTAADSGKAEAPLTISPVDGERVTLFGGKLLRPEWFKPVQDRTFLDRLVEPTAQTKVLVVDLRAHGITEYGKLAPHGWSMEPRNRVPPAFLSIGGKRMTLARWPNADVESPYMVYRHYLPQERKLRGYELTVQKIIDRVRLPGEVTYAQVIDPGDKFSEMRRQGKVGRGGTIRVDFDRMKHWQNIRDIYLDGVLSSTWEWTYNQLASVDIARRTITLARAELNGLGQGESVRLPHFHFQNIPEELDAPGEYYIDRSEGLLYLIPPANFAAGPIVLATLAEPMIAIRRAAHIRLRGLTLDSGRALGISVMGGNNVLIDRCEIANFVAGGVTARGRAIRIANSRIHGTGGHGVHLGGGDFRTLNPAGNEVVNCEIHDFGWDQKSQLPGVMIDGVGHRVAHCNIHDGPHFAIRVRTCNDVVVEYNEIHDLPKYHKFDGGSLYVFTGPRAESRGIVIRHNYFHDIPTIGVYPDNFSWGIVTHGNVFANVGVLASRPAVCVNGGGECRTFNNVMVNCPMVYQQGTRPKEERWFTHWNKTREKFGDGRIENTPYRKYPDLKLWLAKQAPDEFFRPTSHVYRNLFYSPTVPMAPGARPHGIQDKSRRLDAHDNWPAAGDPGFVDIAGGNFALKPDAAVFQKLPGFEPIQFKLMGLLKTPVGP
jgi:hypothetical protein